MLVSKRVEGARQHTAKLKLENDESNCFLNKQIRQQTVTRGSRQHQQKLHPIILFHIKDIPSQVEENITRQNSIKLILTKQVNGSEASDSNMCRSQQYQKRKKKKN